MMSLLLTDSDENTISWIVIISFTSAILVNVIYLVTIGLKKCREVIINRRSKAIAPDNTTVEEFKEAKPVPTKSSKIYKEPPKLPNRKQRSKIKAIPNFGLSKVRARRRSIEREESIADTTADTSHAGRYKK